MVAFSTTDLERNSRLRGLKLELGTRSISYSRRNDHLCDFVLYENDVVLARISFFFL